MSSFDDGIRFQLKPLQMYLSSWGIGEEKGPANGLPSLIVRILECEFQASAM